MVGLAIGLGVYAYAILALGLTGWLYKGIVLGITGLLGIWGVVKAMGVLKGRRKNLIWEQVRKDKDKLVLLALVIFLIQVVVNFLGALSPELSFDALWYHLTPAKLYVQNHQIFYIPGWLLWPANIPRLTDMFYVAALLFSNEILAKLIHFGFGILSAVALFNLLRRYFNLRLSVLGVLIFYTMLIVGWQSTTAYVELARTFFEILALDRFLLWVENKKDNILWEAAILTGLAISTKILAFGTLLAFVVLLFILRTKGWLVNILKFTAIAILVVSPWLVQSFVNTGNPLFPLFGNFYQSSAPGINPEVGWIGAYLSRLVLFPWVLWKATLQPDDIISPVFLVCLPLVILFLRKQKLAVKLTALYVLLGFTLAPDTSNRYLLPYLPGLTLVTLSIFNHPWTKLKAVKTTLLAVIIFTVFLSLFSRLLATRKFLPYLLQKETKGEFLSHRLNFGFGDFYDVDSWFAENIQPTDLVLVYGIHNLYYVDFPFAHESWAKPGTYFTHILVGNNENLPEKFGDRLLLYRNPKTGVKLYLFGGKYE